MNGMDAPPAIHSHHHHHRRITKATSSTSSTNGGGTGGNIKKRQRSNLPKPVTAILKKWLAEHKKHPYPNEDEKCQLVRQTGLARNQISNWFINARRRILRPMLEEGEEDEDEDDHLSYDDKWRSSRRGVNLTWNVYYTTLTHTLFLVHSIISLSLSLFSFLLSFSYPYHSPPLPPIYILYITLFSLSHTHLSVICLIHHTSRLSIASNPRKINGVSRFPLTHINKSRQHPLFLCLFPFSHTQHVCTKTATRRV